MVESEFAGILLGDFLARELPPTASRHLRRLVAAGDVRVNGETCVTNRRLRANDVVQVPLVELPPRGVRTAAPLEVLFESAALLVIHKPPGLPTVPDRSGQGASVHSRLAELRPDADLRIVHRLDRDTSGCLVLAKGLDAARHCDRWFAEGLVHKRYVALVQGVPPATEFVVDTPLGPDPRRPGKVVPGSLGQREFREAVTAVKVREAFTRHALLELRPATGRSHQLRVHLMSIGHPIVGDRDYGGEPLLLSQLKSRYKLRIGTTERPLLDRLFLHAEAITLDDLDGRPVAVECPLPSDLATALRKLENSDRRKRT